jgi:hypothetical protein
VVATRRAGFTHWNVPGPEQSVLLLERGV